MPGILLSASRAGGFISGGVAAGLVLLCLDALSISELLATNGSMRIFLLLGAMHLSLGAVMGGLAALVALGVVGPVDQFIERVRSYVLPPVEQRYVHAVQLFVGSTLLLLVSVVSWWLCVRCFGFNNIRLAAALLVVLLYALHFSALGTWHRLSQYLCKKVEGSRRLRLLLTPMVTLWWPLGLIAGAGVATLELHRTALSETWEALTLAPVAGAVGVILVAYCAEVWIRSRTWVIGLSGLIALAFGAGALTVEPWVSMTGDDNLAVHEARWGGTGLGLLERLTDQDKDGFSPYFGHGDCDDASASTWPGSSEGHDCLVAVETLTDDEMQKLMGRATKRSADEPSSGVDVGTVDAPPVKSKQSKDERDVDSSAATQDSPDSGHAFGQAKEPLQSPKKQVPTALDRPLNMVLITVDTVRADHCGFQGYERDTTPRLDEFARESVVFEKAYAPSNMTPVSIPALLSGRYTSELFRDDAHFIHFDEKNVFVAESLSDAGYETRGILTHWYFEKRKRSGLYQGFDHWSVMGTRWGKAMEDVSTSELVSAEAVRQLQQVPSEQPWFMWIHFLDPHKWYIDHPGFDRRWGRKSRDRYDHEIAFTDHHIGVVLDALRSHPQWKRTAVFISSDHGEAFGEHKTNFHGFSMYEDQLHVPFIVRVPGLEPRRISKRVGLIDVVPTIRELAQLPAVDELHGRSLLAELRGEEVEQRLIYAERPRGPYSAGQRALIQGDHKLVWRAAGNRYELYDLANDPDELNDLTGDMAPMDTRMRAIMATFVNTVLDRKGKVRRGRR